MTIPEPDHLISPLQSIIWKTFSNSIRRSHFGEGTAITIPNARFPLADFQNNVDKIDLTAYGFADTNDAMSHATQVGSDVFFDFGNGDTLLVLDTTLAELPNDLIVTI